MKRSLTALAVSFAVLLAGGAALKGKPGSFEWAGDYHLSVQR